MAGKLNRIRDVNSIQLRRIADRLATKTLLGLRPKPTAEGDLAAAITIPVRTSPPYETRHTMNSTRREIAAEFHWPSPYAPLTQFAHEVRTPLNAMRFSIRILRSNPDRSLRESTLDVMERQLQVLTRLTEDLFHVHEHRGRASLEQFALIDLNEVVRHAAEACAGALRDRQQTLTTLLADDIPEVAGDAIRLGQVVVNMLDNARKYTPAGGRISLVTALEHSHAVVRVQDNGMGITAAQLAAFAKHFRQSGESPDRAHDLGTGLHLVKTFVTAHQGTVEVHSDGVAAGSSFTVRLPACRRNTGTASVALGCEAQHPMAE